MRFEEVEKDEPGQITRTVMSIYMFILSAGFGVFLSTGIFYLKSSWFLAQNGSKFVASLTGIGVVSGIFTLIACMSIFNMAMPEIFDKKTVVKEVKEV